MYLPITSKKRKKEEDDVASLVDQVNKNKKKEEDKKDGKKDSSKSDTTHTAAGSVVNNIYININMDSLLNAKRRGGGGRGGDGTEEDHFDPLDLHEFTHNDYKIDSLNGHREIKFFVYFEFNMYSLNSGAFAAIDKVLAQIHRNPGLSIEIKGYTDDVGTQDYNIFLSRMRAQMVYDYMNSRGIPSDQMSYKYYGKENPVADNNDPNTSWLNRRAEIVIRKK
jgi:outer membrane protein OmpA-like peptidoglycan-associated protein